MPSMSLYPYITVNPFCLEAHLQRLSRSLTHTKIDNPYNEQQWTDIIQKLIKGSGLEQLSVYIQVTRGVAPRDHLFPKGTKPTVFAMTNPWPAVNDDMYSQGLSVITVEDMRWDRCDIKVTSLLANVMKKQEAAEQDAHEAILIRGDKVLEGSATNVFIVKDDQVMTAPKDNLILPGITRDLVVDLVKELSITINEQAPSLEDLRQADEVWITSSTKECAPVTKVDNKEVGTGRPGPIWQQVFDAYQRRK